MLYGGDAPSLQVMLDPLLKLQAEGKLDGTVLIAKGSKEVILLDNSEDKLDPCQGLRGQYGLASTGKQMMAVALLKALFDKTKGIAEKERIEEVKQQLNLPVSNFLISSHKIWSGQMPKWAHKVTLHQLLTHQSGVPDFTKFPAFFAKNSSGKLFQEQSHETAEFLKIIAGQSLDFEPGTAESYSNTGYTLIKEAIAFISQMPAEEYLNQELFKPLGLHDTWAVKEGNWSALRQQPMTDCLLKPWRYDPKEGSKAGFYLAESLEDAGAMGPIQIVSTAIDLLKWNLALHRDHCCFPNEIYELFMAPHSKGPSGVGYGYGIARDNTRFGIALNHSSGSVRNIYIPSEEISLIALTHVAYDWDRVEKIIQERVKTLTAKPGKDVEAQAAEEVLEQYPPENRGFDAINTIFNNFLNSK